MKQLPEVLVVMAVLLAASCSSAIAAEPVPPELVAPTKVRVVSQVCGPTRNERKTFEIEDAVQVKALASEFSALRARPTGIWAAKYSCSADVTFFHGARLLARIHVFPCSSLERAPVEGKRYFTYKEGLNRLPALTQIVGKSGKEKECK